MQKLLENKRDSFDIAPEIFIAEFLSYLRTKSVGIWFQKVCRKVINFVSIEWQEFFRKCAVRLRLPIPYVWKEFNYNTTLVKFLVTLWKNFACFCFPDSSAHYCIPLLDFWIRYDHDDIHIIKTNWSIFPPWSSHGKELYYNLKIKNRVFRFWSSASSLFCYKYIQYISWYWCKFATQLKLL